MTIKIDSLCRYPVKGLSGQPLDSVQLETGQAFPYDRIFGFARHNSGFDPDNPKPLPKSRFHMLARDASLVLINTQFDDNTGVLTMTAADASGHFKIGTPEGKQQASGFLQSYLALPADQSPQLYEAYPHRFTDVSVVSAEMMNAVSLINLDSVTALSEKIGHPIDPRRFRGNIHVTGLPPFSELEKVGELFGIGSAVFKIVSRTKRCPATQVDLDTGERNLDIPALLQEHYGHRDMGIYAEVLEGGTISPGDTLELL